MRAHNSKATDKTAKPKILKAKCEDNTLGFIIYPGNCLFRILHGWSFPPIHPSMAFLWISLFSCVPALLPFSATRQLIPFPWNGTAIVNANTLLLFELFDLSFVFAARILNTTNNTEKKREKKIDHYKWTNTCLEFWSSAQCDSLFFFLSFRCVCATTCGVLLF